MAEDEFIKHTKAEYETLNDPQQGRQHEFKEILAEILIIVFAVTTLIWWHQWNEGRGGVALAWKSECKDVEQMLVT